jgi:RNA polymerase sigma-70 factor (ECF subfamily)
MRLHLRLVERDDGLDTDAGVRAAVQAHSGELYGFAFRALGDQGLAEEVVQETFVRAWRAGRRFDPDIASLRTWLFAILRNVIIDATRARSVRPGVAPTVDVAIADNIDVLLQSWVVEEALRRLTDQHRRAVVEVYYQGRSAVDVAAELGVPAATIRSRLFYGLSALRLALDELGWDDA